MAIDKNKLSGAETLRKTRTYGKFRCHNPSCMGRLQPEAGQTQVKCPECGEPVKRLISGGTGFILKGGGAGGGAATATTYIKNARAAAAAAGRDLFLFDSGDLFQGTPVGMRTKGTAVVDWMK